MGLMPGSPSSVSAVISPFTPPISPSTNGISHSSMNWPQPNVPALHLPGSNLQSSRLRSSLNARDMPSDDYFNQDFEAQQLLKDLYISQFGSSAASRTSRSKSLAASNLDDLFSAEISSSPRYNSEQGAIFSPSHKTAIFNQFQQQQQSLLSPINTGMFSPKSMDQQLPGHSSLFQASLSLPSPGRMSPRSMMEPVSPMSTRHAVFSQQEKHQQQSLRSFSSRDLGSGATSTLGPPMSSSWSKWGSPSGMLDWGVNCEELGRLKRSSSFELRSNSEEPDLSWVHSLVKESTPEKPQTREVGDNDQAAALGAWLEQMQLNQMVNNTNNPK